MWKGLTYPEVGSDLWHLQHQTGSQVLHILQIILHWVWQVHQVVQVNWVIFRSLELQVKSLRLPWIKLPLRRNKYLGPEWWQLFRVAAYGPVPDRKVRWSFWGWIWVISSGFSFSPPFLRFVTGLFLRVFFSPFGLSIMSTSQPLLTRDCSSSQRVDTASPCLRNACEHQHIKNFK